MKTHGEEGEKEKVDEEETENGAGGPGEMRDRGDRTRIEGKEGGGRTSEGEEADRNVPDDESGPRAWPLCDLHSRPDVTRPPRISPASRFRPGEIEGDRFIRSLYARCVVKKCNNSGRTEYREWECKDLYSRNDSRARGHVYTHTESHRRAFHFAFIISRAHHYYMYELHTLGNFQLVQVVKHDSNLIDVI